MIFFKRLQTPLAHQQTRPYSPPHLGSTGRRTRERMAMMAVENLLAVLKGLEPPNPVA